METVSSVRIIVTGKVQGVFFRQSTREHALALGLTGSVENLPDGSVQILASGPSAAISHLLAWCRQGPPRSRVESVHITSITSVHFEGFQILRH
jgi:acylphosphatase